MNETGTEIAAKRDGSGPPYDAALGTFTAMTKAVEHVRHLHSVRFGTSVTVSTSSDRQSGQQIAPGIRAS
jgi:hypothetical protein